MSKSYGNTINLADSPEDILAKVKNMVTDPQRQRLKDPGRPDECNVFSYYKVFLTAKESEARTWCEGAQKGCTDCKKILADQIIEYLRPIRESRIKIEKDRSYLDEVLQKGALRARALAAQTMAEVRKSVFSAA
jgi:tryptophanyl-tRNA synthetase